jgi:archaellum component FlaC
MSGIITKLEFDEYQKAIDEKITNILNEINAIKENIQKLPIQDISKEIDGLKVEVEAIKMSGEALTKLDEATVLKINEGMKDLLEKLGYVLSKLAEANINAKVIWNADYGVFKIYFLKEQ